MIKIKLGGYPFLFPQTWAEVSVDQARRIAASKPEDIQKRLSILSSVPDKRFLQVQGDALLAPYEIISFIEEIPEIVPDKITVPDIASEWNFMEFEAARQAIEAHQNELGVCLYTLAEIKGLESNYLEAGCKFLDSIAAFLEQWQIFDVETDEDGPSALEEAAGIDRLQMFGVYPMLKEIAQRFGMKPSEVEQEPVGWVYLEYFEQREVNRFQENYNKLKGG